MSTYKGMAALKSKLEMKKPRIRRRYKFYEMKYLAQDMGISTPPDLQHYMTAMGWCGKAVDSIADRLAFSSFGNDVFDMNGLFSANNMDVLIDSAILGALISSCDFIYISKDENGFPRMEVIEGQYATGIIDHTTNMLKEGYAVLEYDNLGQPVTEAYLIRCIRQKM